MLIPIKKILLEAIQNKPKHKVIVPAILNNLIAFTVEVKYFTLNKSFILKIKKVKKILKKLLTFIDLCAITTIEGQRKSKSEN